MATNIRELFERLGCPAPGAEIDTAVTYALLELEERRAALPAATFAVREAIQAIDDHARKHEDRAASGHWDRNGTADATYVATYLRAAVRDAKAALAQTEDPIAFAAERLVVAQASYLKLLATPVKVPPGIGALGPLAAEAEAMRTERAKHADRLDALHEEMQAALRHLRDELKRAGRRIE